MRFFFFSFSFAVWHNLFYSLRNRCYTIEADEIIEGVATVIGGTSRPIALSVSIRPKSACHRVCQRRRRVYAQLAHSIQNADVYTRTLPFLIFMSIQFPVRLTKRSSLFKTRGKGIQSNSVEAGISKGKWSCQSLLYIFPFKRRKRKKKKVECRCFVTPTDARAAAAAEKSPDRRDPLAF